MNAFRLYSAFLFCALPILYGCGGSHDPSTSSTNGVHSKQAFHLEAKLIQFDKASSGLTAPNDGPTIGISRLTSNSGVLEEKPTKMLLAAGPAGNGGSPAFKKEKEEEGRIELLGAKALAEFQAKQLRERLDKIGKDLENKEKELGAMKKKAQEKEAQVTQLSETVERIRTEDKRRNDEINSRLEELRAQLATRLKEAEQLKKDLNEKADLLETLKNSVGDCSKVKSLAEEESERLKSQLAEAVSKLAGAKQQLTEMQQDNENFRELTEKMKSHIEQLTDAAVQLKQQADSSSAEVRKLKEQLSKFQSQKPASVQRQEEPPTNLEQLLERTPQRSTGSMEWLY